MLNKIKDYDTCIVGYYGMKNSGDDALLAASVWGAKNYRAAKDITVTTPTSIAVNDALYFPRTLSAQQRFRGQNRLQRYASALKSKQLIFGGGSVFHTAQDINVKRHMMRISSAGKHCALGVGLGPFADVAAENACKKFLHECEYVGLRDQHSFDIASALAPEANIELTFDLAPLLLCDDSLGINDSYREGVAVCLCPKERLLGRPDAEKKRIELLAEALSAVSAATGESIYLVNFNGHERYGDDLLHRELLGKICSKTSVSIVEYDENPIRVLRRMGGFKAVVSMRLHGSIMAYMAGTPALSLNYHDKCEGWCDQIGMPAELRIDCSDFDPVNIFETLVHGLDVGFNEPRLSKADAVTAAKRNWEYSYDA